MKLQLNKYDRICFFGDSITSEGLWIAEVMDYFKDNYPQLNISMFNCGICGSRAGDAHLKDRIYGDCLIYNPKYVVIMFGMNDVEYFCHGTGNDEDKQKIKKAFEDYPKNLLNIINTVKKSGATPIICSPTPYDEVSDVPELVRKGTDDDLKLFAGICKKIAHENGLIFVDMRSAVADKINNNPIRDDRVHPNHYGYHLMAQRFLTAIGAKQTEQPDNVWEMSPLNKKRFDKEQKLRLVMFVEHNGMLWQYEDFSRPVEEKKQIAKQKLRCFEGDWWREVETTYQEYADKIDELRSNIVKYTFDMMV